MNADEPGPGPKPAGPTHPTPTGPPPSGPTKAVAALIADVERQLSAPLHLLVAAVLDVDCDPMTRGHLNAAAQHVSLALSRLAHIKTPVRQDPQVVCAVNVAGGPGKPPVPAGKEPAPGSAAVPDNAACESRGHLVAVEAGASFRTPAPLGPPQFEIGTGPQYDALPPVGRCAQGWPSPQVRIGGAVRDTSSRRSS